MLVTAIPFADSTFFFNVLVTAPIAFLVARKVNDIATALIVATCASVALAILGDYRIEGNFDNLRNFEGMAYNIAYIVLFSLISISISRAMRDSRLKDYVKRNIVDIR
jgi:hypothetical protein